MKKSQITLLAFFSAVVFILLGNLYVHSYSGNAPEVLISIAEDGSLPTCNSCHGGGPTGKIDRTGGISFTKSDGNLYANKVDYDIVLEINSAETRHGFQVIALDASGNSIGTLSDTSADVNTEDDAVKGVTHVSHHNIPNANDAIFNFSWKAPDTYKGEVTFHMIGVAANGNRQATGDKVYYDTLTLQYDASVSVEPLWNQHVKIYPTIINEGIIHIDNLWNGESSVRFINAAGQLIRNNSLMEGENQIDLGSIPQGIYFLQINGSKGETLTKKVLIQ